jgi:hypothetical protein
LERIDTPDIYVLAEALEKDICRPPRHEGEEYPIELSNSVRANAARHDGFITPVETIRATLVGSWLVDERNNRFLGWVYNGPVDLSRYADENPHGDDPDPWLTRMLAPRCIRACMVERDGDNAMIRAELRVNEAS